MIRITCEFICDACAAVEIFGEDGKTLPVGWDSVKEQYCRIRHICPKHKIEVNVVPA